MTDIQTRQCDANSSGDALRSQRVGAYLRHAMPAATTRAQEITGNPAVVDEIVSFANERLWVGQISEKQYLPTVEKDAWRWRRGQPPLRLPTHSVVNWTLTF